MSVKLNMAKINKSSLKTSNAIGFIFDIILELFFVFMIRNSFLISGFATQRR